MNSTARLLAAVSVTKTFTRNNNIYVLPLLCRDIKVIRMTTIPLKYLLIKNLREQASGPEALFSTYLDLLESNVSKKTHKEFRKTIMEQYLNTCYESVNRQTCSYRDNVSNQGAASLVSPNTDPNSNLQENSTPRNDLSKAREKYKAMRKWKKNGREEGREANGEENFIIRLFSYNILAQHLIEMHSYLYKHHDQRSLIWETRKKLLIEEIREAEATVICLQEMQQEHLAEFVKNFEDDGYKYLYKKRTNDNQDGLLLMYRSDMFNLVEYTNVEFFQSGIELLSRDNVAIIVKLSLKDSPQTEVVIATTHLLYNPKRNDVRLGQTQILMAELERIAFIKHTRKGPKYNPIIMAGDFNLQPYSGVYEFITRGSFKFVGKSRTLGPPDHRRLSNSLIPPHLHVTDSSQHYHILVKRLSQRGEGRIMLENSETKTTVDKVDQSPNGNQYMKAEVDIRTQNFQQIEIVDGHCVSFGSGQLTHPFRLRSVYSHKDCNGQNEATTHQDGWITVDYIFFSDVELIEKYTLPTKKQCEALATIPNSGIGSDHLSLGATFMLRKKKRP